MQRKRIYTCLPNNINGSAYIRVTDENGYIINKSNFTNINEAVSCLRDLKEELAVNKQLEVVQIDRFHFEYKRLE